jgi:hypothetical protein
MAVPGELGARLDRVLDVDRAGRVVDVDHHRSSPGVLELDLHVDLVGEDRPRGQRLGRIELAGEFTLKGFQRPVPAFNVVAVRDEAMMAVARPEVPVSD